MIEEFMLLANEVVAEHFYWMEIPFIYRVHEKPEITKLETLRMFLGSLGINIKGSLDNIHPRTIREVLEQAAGMPHENVVSSVTLRSMQKAYYSTQCEGHFGLALKYYCHFTSPIRRYPDLMIHRIIKKSLKGKISQEDISALTAAADNAAQLSSTAERQAIEAEREVEKLKKTEYMEGFVDEEFRGIISGVTNFGIYVQLENTCEGLVRTEDIEDDYYQFIPEKYALIGENTNRVFKLGDEVDVIVYNVSVERREVDFLLAEFE
jgi:ribonuclease R